MAVVSAVAVVLVVNVGRRELIGRTPPLVAAYAKGRSRPVEGRLSGGFGYRPWPGNAAAEAREKVVAAAVMIGTANGAEAHHSSGVTRLLLGEWHQAVDALQLAVHPAAGESDLASVIDRARDDTLLGDFAVALLARGTAEQRPQDLVWAAEAAQAAWAIRMTPETAWNRAVTIEALKLRQPAVAAWLEVIERDASPGWSDEAKLRLRRLQSPNVTDAWRRVRVALEKDLSIAERAAREYPQQSRELVEELLASRDTRSFELARRLAAAVAASSGESLASRSIAAVEAAPPSSREAFHEGVRAYARGRALIQAQEMQAAIAPLTSATAKLAGNPFRQRAALYRANAEYYAGDFTTARRRLRAILADRDAIAASPALEGQAHWILGLMHGASAEWNESLLEYDAAARAFQRIGERENHAAIRGLMAEVLTFVGSGNDAWPHRSAALNDLFVLGPVRRSYSLLHEAARAARELGAERVAVLYASELVAYAESMNDPVSIANALIARAPAAAAAGNMSIADADLRRARGLIRSIPDRVMRVKSETNLQVAEARVLRATDPAAAWNAAARAIARLRETGEVARLPELHYERALAARELRRPEDVLTECTEAIAVTERQRLKLAQTGRRRAFLDRWSPAYSLAVATLVRAGRHEEAFAYAEQSRGRSFIDDAAPPLRYHALSAVLPASTVLVEYAITEEQLLVWVITSDTIAVHRTGVSRRSLDALVERVREAAEATDPQRFRRAAELAYRVVIAPVRSLLRERVIVVPDGALYDLPLAALRDPVTKRYLVEDHEITLAPSAAALVRRPALAPAPASDGGVVLIGNTTPDTAGLETLASARRELQALMRIQPDATLLLDRDATRRNVLAALGGASLAHFAGHAVATRQSAGTALVLSGDRDHSGYLYPDEIERLRLPNLKLLILAGCATGYGARSSDGPSSLARAFLAAGARSVIATHWPVEDSAASPLMIDLHHRLRRGERPAAALRAAQLRAIRTRNFAWTAFHITSLEIKGE